eukprot:Gb_19159 [translate_table: standard]
MEISSQNAVNLRILITKLISIEEQRHNNMHRIVDSDTRKLPQNACKKVSHGTSLPCEVKENADHTKDGTVDRFGRPAIKCRIGGWKAAILVLGDYVQLDFESSYTPVNQGLATLAFFGVGVNLVLFLTRVLQQSNASVANNVSKWTGTVYIFSLVGAFLSDAYLGRYRICTLFLIIFVVGLVLLALSSHLLLLKPAGCGNGSLSCQNASSLEIGAFYLSIYLVALGNGGYQPSIATFRADQFDEEDQREGVSKIAFFSWFYLALNLGSLFSNTILGYLENNGMWPLGFWLSSSATRMSMVVFLLGTLRYFHQMPGVQSMEAERYRDLNEVEVELFSKVKTIDYYTTVAKIKGLDELPVGFYYCKKYAEDPSTIGHPVAIQKFYQDTHIFLFWLYGNSDDINDAVVSRLVCQDVKNMGAEVESVILQRRWNYFPHVSSQDMKRGFYERMEKELQGRQNMYYVGGLMAFELTELNSCYAIDLVCRYFASDKTSPPLPYVKGLFPLSQLKPRMEKVRELGEIPGVEFPELRSITVKNSGNMAIINIVEDVNEKYGPWGGHGGSPFDDGSHKHVKAITVTTDSKRDGDNPFKDLRSIQVDYVDYHPSPPFIKVVKGPKHGGNGKFTYTVNFENRDALAKIIAFIGGICSLSVTSLEFEKLKLLYPPHEATNCAAYPVQSPWKEIVGFFGRSTADCANGCINAIGVYEISHGQRNVEPKLLQGQEG